MRIKIFGLLPPLCLSFCWVTRQSLTGSKFPSNLLVGSHWPSQWPLDGHSRKISLVLLISFEDQNLWSLWPSFSSSMLVWFHSQPIYSCRLDLVVGWTLFFKEVLLCLFRSTLLDTFLKRTHSGCSFSSWLLSCALHFSEENPFRVLLFQLAVELCSTLFWREPIQGAPFSVGCWVASPIRSWVTGSVRSWVTSPLKSWVASLVRSWVTSPVRSWVASLVEELSCKSS